MAMAPTVELRLELRRLIDERILAGMSDADTRFSETELDMLLSNATHIYTAAAEGWRLKATRAMSERGGLEECSAGDEKHKFVSIEAYRDHCLAMAEMYVARTPQSGTRLFRYDLPEVVRHVD